MSTMSSSLPHRARTSATLGDSHVERALHSAHDFSIEAAPSADFVLFPDKTASMLPSWGSSSPTMPSTRKELVGKPRHLPREVKAGAMLPGRTTTPPRGYAPVPGSREARAMPSAAPRHRGRSTRPLLGHSTRTAKPKGSNVPQGTKPGHVMPHWASSQQSWDPPMFDPLPPHFGPLAAPSGGAYYDAKPSFARIRSISGLQSSSSEIAHAEPGYWEFSSTQAATNQSHDESDIDYPHSPPPAPTLERLTTPDLPETESLPFCNCCTTADAGHRKACALFRNRKSQRNFDLLGVGSMFD